MLEGVTVTNMGNGELPYVWLELQGSNLELQAEVGLKNMELHRKQYHAC
jgi:hypothetical protein